MSTISQHISNIRGLIEKYTRTPEQYTDQFIYELLKTSRATAIEEEARKNQKLSSIVYQSYTIKMESADPPNHECVPDYLIEPECKVVVSVCDIPVSLKNRNTELLKVSTLSGQAINLYTEADWLRAKHDCIKSKMLSGSIINGKLYVWNNPKLRYVKISGVFEDPLAWQECPSCDEMGDEVASPCFDIAVDDFAIDEKIKLRAYTLVLELLKIPFGVDQDTSNNSLAKT